MSPAPSLTSRFRWLAFSWFLGLLGCDSTLPEDTTTPFAELGGTADDGSGFVPWSQGAVQANLVSGWQGGQHIWVVVRTRHLDPVKNRVTLSWTDAETGQIIPPGPATWIETLVPQGDGHQSGALTGFVDSPCTYLGRVLRLEALVRDSRGQTATATATVTPHWPGHCQ